MRSAGLLVSLSALLLVGLWWVMKPTTGEHSQARGEPHEFHFQLHPAQAEAPRTLSVYQGDQIRLSAQSSAMAHLHLHDYDLHLYLAPDYPSQVHFVANSVGRFELEWHEGGQRLATLEVYPRP